MGGGAMPMLGRCGWALFWALVVVVAAAMVAVKVKG